MKNQNVIHLPITQDDKNRRICRAYIINDTNEKNESNDTNGSTSSSRDQLAPLDLEGTSFHEPSARQMPTASTHSSWPLSRVVARQPRCIVAADPAPEKKENPVTLYEIEDQFMSFQLKDIHYAKVDLFDNGDKTNTTRYKIKFTYFTKDERVRKALMFSFSNRRRSFKRNLLEPGIEHPFYEEFYNWHEGLVKDKKNYKIQPSLAKGRVVAKQKGEKTFSKLVPFTAAILMQEKGKPPVCIIQIGSMIKELKLDENPLPEAKKASCVATADFFGFKRQVSSYATFDDLDV